MAKRIIVTPKGIAAHPWVTREDRKYGGYKCQLKLTPEQAQEIEEICKELLVDEFGKTKAVKAHIPLSPDKDEDSNLVVLKTASQYKPFVADIKGTPVKAKLRMAGGSIVKLKIELSTYNNDGKIGVKAYLKGVQILKLVEFDAGGFGSAEDEYGEDDGFVADGYVDDSDDSHDDEPDFSDESDNEEEEEDDRPSKSRKGRRSSKSATDF